MREWPSVQQISMFGNLFSWELTSEVGYPNRLSVLAKIIIIIRKFAVMKIVYKEIVHIHLHSRQIEQSLESLDQIRVIVGLAVGHRRCSIFPVPWLPQIVMAAFQQQVSYWRLRRLQNYLQAVPVVPDLLCWRAVDRVALWSSLPRTFWIGNQTRKLRYNQHFQNLNWQIVPDSSFLLPLGCDLQATVTTDMSFDKTNKFRSLNGTQQDHVICEIKSNEIIRPFYIEELMHLLGLSTRGKARTRRLSRMLFFSSL